MCPQDGGVPEWYWIAVFKGLIRVLSNHLPTHGQEKIHSVAPCSNRNDNDNGMCGRHCSKNVTYFHLLNSHNHHSEVGAIVLISQRSQRGPRSYLPAATSQVSSRAATCPSQSDSGVFFSTHRVMFCLMWPISYFFKFVFL